MSIPEAVQLVLQAAALSDGRRDLHARDGRAGAHHRPGQADDPAVRLPARHRHRDPGHRRPPRREARGGAPHPRRAADAARHTRRSSPCAGTKRRGLRSTTWWRRWSSAAVRGDDAPGPRRLFYLVAADADGRSRLRAPRPAAAPHRTSEGSTVDPLDYLKIIRRRWTLVAGRRTRGPGRRDRDRCRRRRPAPGPAGPDSDVTGYKATTTLLQTTSDAATVPLTTLPVFVSSRRRAEGGREEPRLRRRPERARPAGERQPRRPDRNARPSVATDPDAAGRPRSRTPSATP